MKITFNLEEFKNGLSLVLPFRANQKDLKNLNNLYIKLDTELILLASDGTQLSMYKIPYEKDFNFRLEMVLDAEKISKINLKKTIKIYNEYVLIDNNKIPIINIRYPDFLDYAYKCPLFSLGFNYYDYCNDLISFLKSKIKTPNIIEKHFSKINEDLESLSNNVIISFKPCSSYYTDIIFEHYDFITEKIDNFEIENCLIYIGEPLKLREYSITMDLRKILKFLEVFNKVKILKLDFKLDILEEGIRFETLNYTNIIPKITSNKEEIIKNLKEIKEG